jgi:hypothetical protein
VIVVGIVTRDLQWRPAGEQQREQVTTPCGDRDHAAIG